MSKNLTELMSSLTCNGERSESCMLGLCEKYENKKLPTLPYEKNLSSFYYKWTRVDEERTNKKGEKYVFKAMTKQKLVETQDNIVEHATSEIPDFLIHLHNVNNQYQFNKEVDAKLNPKP